MNFTIHFHDFISLCLQKDFKCRPKYKALLMTTYLNSWEEFKSVVEGTSRKLLKKTGFAQAITQLTSLSAEMQDDELSQHAVLCHTEQARIYRKLNNNNEERKQYVVAAHILNNALQQIQEGPNSRSRAHGYLRREVTVLYSRAVKLCMEMKDLRIAGLTSLEAAKVLSKCMHHDMAAEHAQRAVRLLEGDFIAHTQALYCLATIHFRSYQWGHLLADIDEIWMAIMKNRSKSPMGRRVLKDLEVITVLILWKTQLSQSSSRHKMLMNLYADTHVSHGWKKSASCQSANENSALSLQEFLLVQNFLSLLTLRKIQEARILLLSCKSGFDRVEAADCIKSRLLFLSPLAVQVILLFTDKCSLY
ncbi:hypothetical protein GCK32_000240 [Trichostrongylus colubriformis]|uniref:Uncharacterized protein n=1 Tax=Trichostrongylus colubriformis TaxID=6319 RepID=A0AAN8F4E5_TRICO